MWTCDTYCRQSSNSFNLFPRRYKLRIGDQLFAYRGSSVVFDTCRTCQYDTIKPSTARWFWSSVRKNIATSWTSGVLQRKENIFTALFNNMRTPKFKAQQTNAFFAAINQVFGSSSLLSTATERAVKKSNR